MYTTKRIGLIFLILLAITISVSAGGYSPVKQDISDGSGSVEISVLCHNNLFSKEMILTNNIAPTEGKSIFLDHTGKFNDRFIPGDYTVVLLDGNGGQPETKKFRIDGGYTSYVTFIGHAISNGGGQVEPENPCNDLVITTGDIHRVFLLSWFTIHVSNPNDSGWTKSDVVITDSSEHVVFDGPIYAVGGSTYSFMWPASNSHRTHNPLTVSVSGTVCKEHPESENLK